jgi:hypothetical protein
VLVVERAGDAVTLTFHHLGGRAALAAMARKAGRRGVAAFFGMIYALSAVYAYLVTDRLGIALAYGLAGPLAVGGSSAAVVLVATSLASRRPSTITFDDDGIHEQGGAGGAHHPWSWLVKAVELPDGVELFTGGELRSLALARGRRPRQLLVTRRALGDAAFGRLEALLARHAGERLHRR